MGRLLGQIAARVRGSRPWGHNATRLAILEAARRIAASDGPSAVSLSRTADEAVFARPTVYAHFRNKEELLVSVVADDLATLGRAMRKTSGDGEIREDAEDSQEEQSATEETAGEDALQADEAVRAQEPLPSEEPAERDEAAPVEDVAIEAPVAEADEFTPEEISAAIEAAQPGETVLELSVDDALADANEEDIRAPEPEDAEPLWQDSNEPAEDAGESEIESVSEDMSPEPPAEDEIPRTERRSEFAQPRMDAWLERRLRVFEHSLRDITAKVEQAERVSARAEGLIVEGLRDLQQHLDAAETNAKDAAGSLLRRLEAAEQRSNLAVSTLRADILRLLHPEGMSEPQMLVHEDKLSFIPAPAEPEAKPKAQASDSFLDAARRAASAAAELADTDRGQAVMGVKLPANDESRKRYTRYIISGVAILALTVIGASLVLRHGESDVKKMSALPRISSANAAIEAPARHATAPLDRLTQLANAGDPQAELIVGLKYMEGGQGNSSAAQWLLRSANAHNPVAAYTLGTLYENGLGVGKNANEAVRWYEQAANGGNRKAMYRLGILYAQGTGAGQDYAQSASWFAKAANAGLVDAQFNLAVLYERGQGVPQSLLDAYKWYAIAASHGDKESQARAEALSAQLTPDDLQVAEKTVQEFTPADFDHEANLVPTIADVTGP